MNTHIVAQEFEYLEPKTIEEAILQLNTYGDKAKVIAGGTDLIVRMKRDMVHPEVSHQHCQDPRSSLPDP